MAVAPTLFPGEPGGALMTLLTQGVGALNSAINNAIKVGQDRATTQLNQENTVFNVLQNQERLNLRKAENLRSNFETDRLFGRTVARDVREDFTTDRAFERRAYETDREYAARKEAADRGYALDVRKTDAAIQSDKDRLAIAASKNELDAIQTNLQLLDLGEKRKLRNDLVDTTETLRQKAIGGTTADVLGSPGQVGTLPIEELTAYVDTFRGVQSPDVQARVNVAERELATRAPALDPVTGKRIPDRFAPDRDNPFIGKTPQEAAVVAQSIQQQIADIDDIITAAKAKSPGRTNTALSSLIKQRSALIDQLNKGPVGAASAAPSPAPGSTAVEKLFE